MRLANSTVLVTGASGGIGAETARVLADRGADVVLHGRNRELLDVLAAELAAPTVVADLSTRSGVDALIAGARSLVGPVDAVVHCAGVGWRGEVTAMSADDVARLIAVNLHAPIQLTRAFLPSMRAAGRGHVAFVGSIAGLTGVCHEAVYSAGKAGLDAFAESLRMELAGSGVGVSTLSPGAVDTGFWTARGSEYHRRIPRLVGAQRVARLLVADIEHERSNRIVPRWLALAPFTRALAPSAYRHLATRFG
ncbi:MAG TPA: SDR family NAD(P)-dependent oxidoreductase [Jatrophihabitantaceae bacterium]|nr:SDR family NAD(P)-dependent oxidoreductase [Jatrophihabitantaceae bacterium]